MKRSIYYFLLCLPLFTCAQDKGIIFAQNMDWRQIQAKAKKEHQYIFVDCFATWCGPCTAMETRTSSSFTCLRADF